MTATARSVTPMEPADVDFNRLAHPDRPLRPIPPGRDVFAERWRRSREFLFAPWIDIDVEVGPNDLTRARDDYFWQADEHMIGVVEMFEELGHKTARVMFEQALTEGIDTVEEPHPALIALFDQLDNVPEWFDHESAERGRILVSSSTIPASMLILGWAFFETAMTGDISAATGATGRFRDQGPRRYLETFRMFAMMATPQVYGRFNIEFQTVVRVRLMHALVSRGLRRSWGDDVYLKYGEPIAAASLLGFGNGPLLLRLADHQLGRRLSPSDLDDIAMYASFTSWLLGAPESLRCRDGLELIKSLNYIFARGGDPSQWRAEVVDTQPAFVRWMVDATVGWLPEPARAVLAQALDINFAVTGLVPLVMVFGADQIDELLADSEFEKYPINYRILGQGFEAMARVHARAVRTRDQIPGMAMAKRVYYRNGVPGQRGVIDGLEGVLNRMGMRSTYTHHDRSPAGAAFTGGR